jgi:hypothetical protein
VERCAGFPEVPRGALNDSYGMQAANRNGEWRAHRRRRTTSTVESTCGGRNARRGSMSPGVTVNPALAELPVMYPTAEGFHDGTDERRAKFSADEWAGIDSFPFLSAELSLLAVSDRVIDVPGELGPPSMLSRTRATGLPAKPNWYPREGGGDAEDGWVETAGSPELYAAEVRASGPVGTVVAGRRERSIAAPP